VLLKFDTNEPSAAGTALLAEGKEVGHVSRAAFSPALNSAIAMAYVRRENSAPGEVLSCNHASATVVVPPLQ
jgi:glycine cleavage system aminomethyltransferase T